MEPRIKYAKTSDGVNIAFATYGEGSAVVWSSQPITSHVQREWQIPIFRAAFAAFAAQRMLVRFDTRGVGLSDRDVDDFSLEARVRDLEAVAEHLHLKQFSLLGLEVGGLPAIAYAASHPERVSHLVLLNCFARGGESQRGQGLAQLMDADWEMFTENVSAQAFGFGFEGSTRYAEFIRECITQEVLARMIEADEQIDLSSLLSEIQAPTLVVRHSGLKLPMDETRRLAAGIPNARLYEVEGFYQDNLAQLHTTMLEFLGVEVGSAAEEPRLDAGAFRTILFTDVEGSTALTERLGDAKARDLLREHERIVREALSAHGGSEVKTMGDGFMASFTSATKALECAIAIQRVFAQHNDSADEPIKVRVGLNAGEPIAEDDPGGRGDLFGTAVNMAARIAAKAEGGEILASNVVRELVAGKNFLFNDRGETELRGFEDPVRVYEVRWGEGD
ncbi:MAG: alpha/beta fold hydrolase [Chloroflexi bacterium]|nr:alpha/beta fold hydrolase [Chloroflexota bacterium]